MIDESNLLNFYCSGIYDTTKALTETEIIMKVLEKINLLILNFNNLESQTLNNMKNLEKQVNYYLDNGMKLEVDKKIEEICENGTLGNIINNDLLFELNNQLSANTEDIEEIKKALHLNNK